jgi:hypothetical protein
MSFGKETNKKIEYLIQFFAGGVKNRSFSLGRIVG